MQPLASDDPVEIGRYRLQGRLGAGGMGRVYLASTPAGRPVAVKVVRPELSDDPEFRARFRQEIQAAQRVHGLYTAQLLDADPDATPPWLVTAYVPGPSLQQAVAGSGPMPETEVFRLAAGVAEALQAIHSAGLVHRDLKPSNVVLGPDGPRVIDFGIARALEASGLTRSGITMGTAHFMAPEQILNLPVTLMIDIFSLGALAAYAALGRPPFGSGHPAAVSHRVVYEPPDLGGCPPQLRTLVEACLAKQPSDRPSLDQILEFCLEHAAAGAESRLPSAAAAIPALSAAPGPMTGSFSLSPHTPGPPVTGPPSRPGPPAETETSARQPPPATDPRRPIPPPPIINAVRLIYAGGLLSICGVLLAIVDVPALRAVLQPSAVPEASLTAPTVVAAAVILSALAGGVWLWTARRIKRAWRWARLVSTAFFAFNSLGIFGSAFSGTPISVTFAPGLAEWGVGLVAIVFLWDRRSGQYFAESRQARSLATPQWPRPARPRGGSRHRRTS